MYCVLSVKFCVIILCGNMAKFLYRAKNERGQIVTGTVTARNEFEAEKALLENSLFAVDIVSERHFD